VLAVIQTIKQSVNMFKATKQWQPNKYMQQLMTDGILYFLVYVFFNITVLLHSTPTYAYDVAWSITIMISYMVITPMMPRFIISIPLPVQIWSCLQLRSQVLLSNREKARGLAQK
ncbi:hypothetical protein V8E55_009880, partial [Tylopilus felleus]